MFRLERLTRSILGAGCVSVEAFRSEDQPASQGAFLATVTFSSRSEAGRVLERWRPSSLQGFTWEILPLLPLDRNDRHERSPVVEKEETSVGASRRSQSAQDILQELGEEKNAVEKKTRALEYENMKTEILELRNQLKVQREEIDLTQIRKTRCCLG